MALKRPKGHPGTLIVLEHSSTIVKGDPLGTALILAVMVAPALRRKKAA